jgi:hypothetical protein
MWWGWGRGRWGVIAPAGGAGGYTGSGGRERVRTRVHRPYGVQTLRESPVRSPPSRPADRSGDLTRPAPIPASHFVGSPALLSNVWVHRVRLHTRPQPGRPGRTSPHAPFLGVNPSQPRPRRRPIPSPGRIRPHVEIARIGVSSRGSWSTTRTTIHDSPIAARPNRHDSTTQRLRPPTTGP